MAVNYSPTDIKQVGPQTLGIRWDDGHESRFAVRNLRLACRCAECVDEWTRRKILEDETVSLEIKPLRIETVGRYALSFQWSDGHSSGIYAFDYLRSLCECQQCHGKVTKS